jgi:hypothetical protein
MTIIIIMAMIEEFSDIYYFGLNYMFSDILQTKEAKQNHFKAVCIFGPRISGIYTYHLENILQSVFMS